MLLFHLVVRHLAVEHALVQRLQMNIVEVPDNDRQYRKDSFGSMSGLGRRDGLPGQKARYGDGVPQHESRDGHDDRAPDHCPVFHLLTEVVAGHLGMFFGETQVVTDDVDCIGNILKTWQHGHFGPAHPNLVAKKQNVVHALNHDPDGSDPVDDAHRLDAAHEGDHAFRKRVAHELLRQAGDGQG